MMLRIGGWIAIVALLVGGVAFATGEHQAPEPVTPADVELAPTVVVTAPVAEIGGRGELRLFGVVRSARRATLAFTVPGRLGMRGVSVGDRVEAGQIVARLEGGQFVNGVDAARAGEADARAQLSRVERDLSRVQALVAQKAAGAEELEALTAGVEAARAGVDSARARVREARRQSWESVLKAPFAGVITDVYAEAGEYSRPGSPIVAISATGSLEVELQVAEGARARLQPGAQVTVDLPIVGRAGLTGRVVSIGAATGARRLFPVVVELPAAEGLAPGVAAEVLIAGDGAPEKGIPLAALASPSGKDPFVFRVRAGEVRRVPVTVRALVGDRVTVDSALAVGDAVVVQGQSNLVDGQLVAVQP